MIPRKASTSTVIIFERLLAQTVHTGTQCYEHCLLALLNQEVHTARALEVSAGGVQLSQGLNFYNVLRHAKDALYGNKNSATLGHPDMVRVNSYVDGTLKLNDETYSDASGQCQFAIDHWEGFLGTCEPKILDAALLPELVVTIYLASTNVLSNSSDSSTQFGTVNVPYLGGTVVSRTEITNQSVEQTKIVFPSGGNATFELKNMHATIECIGLADAVYDNMVASMIAAKGFIEIPFKQYFSFSTTHTNSSRFTVATQSLDRIWACFRPTGYDTIGPPISVSGHKIRWRKILVSAHDEFFLYDHGFTTGDKVSVIKSDGTAQTGNDGYVAVVSDLIFELYSDFELTTKIDLSASESDDAYIANYTKQSNIDLSFKDCATEKYIGKYFNFSEPATAGAPPPTYQYQLNGAYYPQFPASAEGITRGNDVVCDNVPILKRLDPDT